MEPSSLGSFVLNLMEGSKELMCCRNSSFFDCFSMTKLSSTYIFHNPGGFTADVEDLYLNYTIYKFATTGHAGDPIAAPFVCS